jgi:hypothetical protein
MPCQVDKAITSRNKTSVPRELADPKAWSDPSPDQSSREKAYRVEYLKWVSSLDPRDRATLKDMGLDRPKIEATAAVWGRAEVFRDAPASERFSESIGPIDHTHPGELIDEPEDENDIDEDELAKLGAYDPELVACILRVCFFPAIGRCGVSFGAAFHRLIALAHCMKVEGVGDKSLEYIANRVGCTRGVLSHYAVRIRDAAKLDHRSGKSDKARQRLSTAHLWIPGSKTKHRKKAGALPCIDTEKITEGAV